MEVNDNDKTAVPHARNNIYTADGIDRFYQFLIDTYLKETHDKIKCRMFPFKRNISRIVPFG